jgi:hypothetical protein
MGETIIVNPDLVSDGNNRDHQSHTMQTLNDVVARGLTRPPRLKYFDHVRVSRSIIASEF